MSKPKQLTKKLSVFPGFPPPKYNMIWTSRLTYTRTISRYEIQQVKSSPLQIWQIERLSFKKVKPKNRWNIIKSTTSATFIYYLTQMSKLECWFLYKCFTWWDGTAPRARLLPNMVTKNFWANKTEAQKQDCADLTKELFLQDYVYLSAQLASPYLPCLTTLSLNTQVTVSINKLWNKVFHWSTATM